MSYKARKRKGKKHRKTQAAPEAPSEAGRFAWGETSEAWRKKLRQKDVHERMIRRLRYLWQDTRPSDRDELLPYLRALHTEEELAAAGIVELQLVKRYMPKIIQIGGGEMKRVREAQRKMAQGEGPSLFGPDGAPIKR